MKKLKFQLLPLFVIFFTLNLFFKTTLSANTNKKAKEIVIEGVLVDSYTKTPLSSTKVSINSKETFTDKSGKFKIIIPYKKTIIIKASGQYQPEEKELNGYVKKINLGKIYIEKAVSNFFVYGYITKNGKPVTNVEVKFIKENDESVIFITYSNKKGYYEITLKDAAYYRVYYGVNGAEYFFGKMFLGGDIKERLDIKFFSHYVKRKKYNRKRVNENDIFSGKTMDKFYDDTKKDKTSKKKTIKISEDSRDVPNKFITKELSLDLPKTQKNTSKKSNKKSTPEKTTKSGIKEPKRHEVIKEAMRIPSSSKKRRTKKSGLKASFVDDNKQFNYFLNFLKKYRIKETYHIDVSERFIIKFHDEKGNNLPDVEVKIYSSDGKLLEKGLTYSDGTYLFFASMYDKNSFRLEAKYKSQTVTKLFGIQDKRSFDIKFNNVHRGKVDKIPLDLLFIFDTTGSMSEEIKRLKATIELINLNLLEFKPKPDLRFGMVLYKDTMDVYVTKIIPFTRDFNAFTSQLRSVVSSGGGGDGPEDLQKALYDAMKKIKWRKNGVKTAFIITDAQPHLYPKEKNYTYIDAAIEAKSKGIKLYSLGSGGLNLAGEYVLRQLSQFTSANYIFLTYGETGESEGGKPGSVSHHTGENFNSKNLETVLINILKNEMRHYLGKPIEVDEYFEANPVKDEKPKETLDMLFTKAINQLYDYSGIKIEKNTPTAISPIVSFDKTDDATAEYFTENLQFALVKNKKFKAVERKDLQPVLKELKFQLDELSDESKAAELGKFLGAKFLIIGKLYKKNEYYELYLKLLNVETVEILSVTKLKINKKLGLE